MVSLWPWKRDESSPASFEKALSVLSKKITTTQVRLDKARTTARRIRVLWTLYLSFAYTVYAIVLFLVVGFKKLGPLEWTGVAGGPVLIYVVRTAVTAFFNFRIESLSARLKEQQAERAKTIQKLKEATKYDSTLELLEKYGGPENKPSKRGKTGGSGEDDTSTDFKRSQRGGADAKASSRTNMPPPPTANIPRNEPPPFASPQPPRHFHVLDPAAADVSASLEASAEFAPNAFGPGGPPPPPPRYAPTFDVSASGGGGGGGPHWYDRILDLLLGEDETAARNRIVLICKRCRLVNGQAPPGTRSLADLGSWKCVSCGALNGEIDEGKRIVEEVLGARTDDPEAASYGESEGADEETKREGSDASGNEGAQQCQARQYIVVLRGFLLNFSLALFIQTGTGST
ncbi:hypothetical protein VTK73DRAFT_8231 [Phialemonium thermophilum]|uniref:Endoplasmic reticulum junction formation protein lunapark n=1 Tax=Phialemonium thermophilum TaxID=223376 RepID=A0ABR3W9A6_9PEZI